MTHPNSASQNRPQVFPCPVGPFGTNCYIVVNHKKECLIIDPGGDAPVLINEIAQVQGKPIAILLTHAHFDHVGAVDDLVAKYQIPLYMHSEEVPMLSNPELNVSSMTGMPVEIQTKPELFLDAHEFGDFKVRVFHTPGHTIGGCCLEIDGVLFSGDTLFYRSVGRTDFPGGSMTQLKESIKKLFKQLPEEMIAFPGHGPETRLGDEAKQNPFL